MCSELLKAKLFVKNTPLRSLSSSNSQVKVSRPRSAPHPLFQTPQQRWDPALSVVKGAVPPPALRLPNSEAVWLLSVSAELRVGVACLENISVPGDVLSPSPPPAPPSLLHVFCLSRSFYPISKGLALCSYGSWRRSHCTCFIPTETFPHTLWERGQGSAGATRPPIEAEAQHHFWPVWWPQRLQVMGEAAEWWGL